jgi:hypothetical protein
VPRYSRRLRLAGDVWVSRTVASAAILETCSRFSITPGGRGVPESRPRARYFEFGTRSGERVLVLAPSLYGEPGVVDLGRKLDFDSALRNSFGLMSERLELASDKPGGAANSSRSRRASSLLCVQVGEKKAAAIPASPTSEAHAVAPSPPPPFRKLGTPQPSGPRRRIFSRGR